MRLVRLKKRDAKENTKNGYNLEFGKNQQIEFMNQEENSKYGMETNMSTCADYYQEILFDTDEMQNQNVQIN